MVKRLTLINHASEKTDINYWYRYIAYMLRGSHVLTAIAVDNEKGERWPSTPVNLVPLFVAGDYVPETKALPNLMHIHPQEDLCRIYYKLFVSAMSFCIEFRLYWFSLSCIVYGL